MRRNFGIRVAFAPTRLAGEHLLEAYGVVMPVSERTIAIVDANDVSATSERRLARPEGRRRVP
jgi:hypothetical protein